MPMLHLRWVWLVGAVSRGGAGAVGAGRTLVLLVELVVIVRHVHGLGHRLRLREPL